MSNHERKGERGQSKDRRQAAPKSIQDYVAFITLLSVLVGGWMNLNEDLTGVSLKVGFHDDIHIAQEKVTEKLNTKIDDTLSEMSNHMAEIDIKLATNRSK